jgi:hypothetical protein
MSFDDEIKRPSSNKFYMVRMQGGKLLNKVFTLGYTYNSTGFDWQLFTGTIQKYLRIESLIIQGTLSSGVDFTCTSQASSTFPTSGDGIASNNKYYYNPSTGEFKLFTRQVSQFLQDSESLMLEYQIFFTNFLGKHAPYDLANGELVYWQPRLPKDLSLGFSQENNLSGVLSVSTSAIQLKNNDLYFNDFFSANDSFNNRPVECWRCIDDYSINQFGFKGVIRSASFDDDSCSFDINDITSVLDGTCYGGYGYAAYEDYKFYESTSGTYTISPDDFKKPIYRVLGKISPYDVFYEQTGTDYPIRLLSEEKTLDATCVSYNPNSKTTSTNRVWSCGFGAPNANLVALLITANASINLGTFTYGQISVSGGRPSEKFCVGDTFFNGTQYGIVTGVADLTSTTGYILTWPYNASLTLAPIERHKVSGMLIIQGQDKFYPLSQRDYTCVVGPLGDMQVTFTNNFEASVGMTGPLDPDGDQVYFRMWNDSADAIASIETQKILIEAGLDVESSFAPPQGSPDWYDPYISMSIPAKGESSFPTFSDVVEKILRSALSFIYLDNAGKFRYKSFLDGIYDYADITNQSGSDANDGLNQTNSSKFSVSFDLYDLYAGVKFLMKSAPQSAGFFANSPTSYDFGSDINRLRLYKTNKVYEVESVVDTNGPDLDDFLKAYTELMTGAQAKYSLGSFSRHFKLYVGDDILVTRTKILGGENSRYMRVVAISKESNESQLKLLDLKHFPTSL